MNQDLMKHGKIWYCTIVLGNSNKCHGDQQLKNEYQFLETTLACECVCVDALNSINYQNTYNCMYVNYLHALAKVGFRINAQVRTSWVSENVYLFHSRRDFKDSWNLDDKTSNCYWSHNSFWKADYLMH